MDTIPLSTSSLANGVRFGMCGYIAEGGKDRPYSRRYIKSIKWNVQCPTGNMECSSSTQAQYCAEPEGAVPAVGKFAINVLLVAALFDSPFWILQCTFYLISFPFISSPPRCTLSFLAHATSSRAPNIRWLASHGPVD